jgi:hypothetical protein
MISKSWRRVLLPSVAVAALLLLPAASQAAPRASHANAPDRVARIAEPAQWLNRLWEAVTGFWQAATAGNPTGQGDPADPPASDSGLSIDPDGGHGG